MGKQSDETVHTISTTWHKCGRKINAPVILFFFTFVFIPVYFFDYLLWFNRISARSHWFTAVSDMKKNYEEKVKYRTNGHSKLASKCLSFEIVLSHIEIITELESIYMRNRLSIHSVENLYCRKVEKKGTWKKKIGKK